MRGRGSRPGRIAFAGGCGAALVTPFAAGICLGCVVACLGPDFPGEAKARSSAERYARALEADRQSEQRRRNRK
jgi:hypothetical protein